MPARKKARSDSSDEDSISSILEAQRRVIKLRAEKEAGLQHVVDESRKAMDNLRSRIQEHYEYMRQERIKAHAKHIDTILFNVDRRNAIEMEMVEIVKNMQARMREVEEMLLAGYKGRQQDVKAVLG